MGEKLTREMQIHMRKENVLAHALTLFCRNGLEETSIEQIAKSAGIGPASIYRYFDTKAELAIRCGIYYWKQTSKKYIGIFSEEKYNLKNGYDQMKMIMELLQQIYKNESSFLYFLQEFDIFVKKYDIAPERLNCYEEYILNLKVYVTDALDKGMKDGSLYFEKSVDEVYFSIMHTMISLMQKLSVQGEILSSDLRIDGITQLQIVSELLLRGLKK